MKWLCIPLCPTVHSGRSGGHCGVRGGMGSSLLSLSSKMSLSGAKVAPGEPELPQGTSNGSKFLCGPVSTQDMVVGTMVFVEVWGSFLLSLRAPKCPRGTPECPPVPPSALLSPHVHPGYDPGDGSAHGDRRVLACASVSQMSPRAPQHVPRGVLHVPKSPPAAPR